MDNLRLIEKELVPVYETSTGEKVVNGRELHSVLQSKQDFSTWVKARLKDCDALENSEYSRFHKKMEANNATLIEYIIKLDTAKEMAMLERNERGKRVRRYFIQIEEKYQQLQKDPLSNAFENMSPELKAVIVVDQRVTKVEGRMEKLENNMTITHEQMQVIKHRVNKCIVDLLGGKESGAYKDKHLRSKAYCSINTDYCDYFRINARANTLAVRYEDALQYIDMWQPDTNLRIAINECNAQISSDTEVA